MAENFTKVGKIINPQIQEFTQQVLTDTQQSLSLLSPEKLNLKIRIFNKYSKWFKCR